MNLIVFIIVGAIAGFLAGKVMTGHGLGLIWDTSGRLVSSEPVKINESLESEGSMPVLRPAVRLILFDNANRLLLVRFEDSSRQVSWWAAPGGGLKPGENYEEALKREVFEEAGHHLLDPGSWIWTREHVIELERQRFRQQERFYSTRTDAFEPVSQGLEPVETAHVRSLRWWTLSELEATQDELSPRELPRLIRRLLKGGPPREPIQVGV